MNLTSTQIRALQELQAKQAIGEVLLRCGRGCDRFDTALLKSVYWEDAIEDHGHFVGLAHDLADAFGGAQADYAIVHHLLGSPLITLCDRRASAETYFQCMVGYSAMHEKGATRMIVGGRYQDVFEEREDVWKILSRTVIWDWNQEIDNASNWPRLGVPADGKFGAPKPDDPSYRQDQAKK